MPEYLSPGVYVEEVARGPRPIEGVSTSTGAMVGLTERGPENVPILITSQGEYARWFGGRINPADFVDPVDPERFHGYPPYAVEGFFRNGGRRLYMVRVMPEAAGRARFVLHIEDAANLPQTRLLRPARVGTGTGALPPALHVVDLAGLAAPNTVRVGDGSRAEYHTIAATPAGTVHVVTDLPLSLAHNAGATVETVAFATAGPLLTLVADAGRGVRVVVASGGAPAVGATLEIREPGSGARSEFRRIVSTRPSGADLEITFDSGLSYAHPAGDNLEEINLAGAAGTTTLDEEATGGDVVLYPSAPGGLVSDLLIVEPGTAQQEVRRTGELHRLALDPPAYADYPARSCLAEVTLADDAAGPRALTAAAEPGATALSLDNRVGLVDGSVVRIGVVGPGAEYLTVIGFGSARTASPDPGTVVVAQPLRTARAAGELVASQLAPGVTATTPASVVFREAAGSATIDVTRGAPSLAVGDFVTVTTPAGTTFFHALTAVDALAPQTVELTDALLRNHDSGAVIAARTPLIEVEALDRGAWGNRLRVSVAPFARGRVPRTAVTAAPTLTQLTLASLTGVEEGTVLSLIDSATGEPVEEPIKVRQVDPNAGNLVTLDPPGMTNNQRSAVLNAVILGNPLTVRSIEFSLTIRLMQQGDPSRPEAAEEVLDFTEYEGLSLDPRHTAYVERAIGDIDGDLRLSDNRPEGDDPYVRVRDLAPNPAAAQAIRLMPEALVDVLPSGRTRPARHPFAEGTDGMAAMANGVYIGADNVEPELRTGLFALTRVKPSLVGFPGQSDQQLQQALIDHCEADRYRFALLDGVLGGLLADVLAQRQQYSTTYAALYTPWPTIPHPFPPNPAIIEQFPVPASGAMMGLIARVDNERGVHKAPANEVIRGVTGLNRIINQAEQDILNPRPTNISALRRFDNRGIRAYGARVITADPQLTFISVRRLLIFIEQSLDEGLQWAVFEPNSVQLWADVRQSVSRFLEDVWRGGALEGTKPEEAFFVRCDRTTMTQNDIDNGRLIVVVGVAPVKPAEFVIIRIGQFTADAV